MTEIKNKRKLTAALAAQWRKSTCRRLVRWFFSWRIIRRNLFALAGVITLIALFYTVENWRGARAWNQYEKEFQVRGEPLSFEDIIPPPVPDDQNFAATPFWSGLRFRDAMQHRPDTNRWPQWVSRAMNHKGIRPEPVDQIESHALFQLTDLPALALAVAREQNGIRNADPVDLPAPTNVDARVNAAKQILAELTVYNGVFEELRAASSRPSAQFPVEFDAPNPLTILLPHLSQIKSVCQTLRLKAAAEFAVGRPDRALSDVELMLVLADSIRSEPILISHLVRMACLWIACHIVWEGQYYHAWDETQLRQLQDRFADYDLLKDNRFAMTGERVFMNGFFDFLLETRQSQDDVAAIIGNGNGEVARIMTTIIRMAPRGWLQFERLHYNQFLDDTHPAYADPAPKRPRVSPSLTESATDTTLKAIGKGSPVTQFFEHRLLTGLLLPALSNVYKKAAHRQALVEMTVISCALERFRMKNGHYPDRQDELVPDYLAVIPIDVVSTETYRYQPIAGEDSFVLYSIGWNETDDGGTVSKLEQEGDWTWSFPPKTQ